MIENIVLMVSGWNRSFRNERHSVPTEQRLCKIVLSCPSFSGLVAHCVVQNNLAWQKSEQLCPPSAQQSDNYLMGSTRLEWWPDHFVKWIVVFSIITIVIVVITTRDGP